MAYTMKASDMRHVHAGLHSLLNNGNFFLRCTTATPFRS
ncbi:hypothetical protein SMETP3_46660 (plasmid) [Serratia marcescens]|nr:hypothetical protein SMETP3_46660 [Serratia marcescens]BEO78951.1 hypothetical protein SMTE4_49210 [Serratia marcescens]CAI1915362.1 Uncharacterised protein [Serratia marcescens]